MAKTKFRPLHDRAVRMKSSMSEEKSKGGNLIIPDTAKEKPSQGESSPSAPGGHDKSAR